MGIVEAVVIYVSVAQWGYGDERDKSVLYAGTSYEKAKEALKDFVFPDEYNNWGILSTWIDGKETKQEYIRE